MRLALDDVDAVSLMTDFWSSISNDSYLGVTYHYITPNWKLWSLVLQTRTLSDPLESHTAVNVAGALEEVAEEWGLLAKCQGITTDNGRNMVKAVSRSG